MSKLKAKHSYAKCNDGFNITQLIVQHILVVSYKPVPCIFSPHDFYK